MKDPVSGALHHVEIRAPDLDTAIASLGWLLEALGYTLFQSWSNGRSRQPGPTHLVFEQSPALTSDRHERRRPGLNHRHSTARLAPARRRPPPARGGEQHHAAYLENNDGFEIELVAISPTEPVRAQPILGYRQLL